MNKKLINRGILFFWRSIFQSKNHHSKDTSDYTEIGSKLWKLYIITGTQLSRDISNIYKYTVTVKNKFHTLQKYENIVTAHIEAAAESIST